MGDNSCTRVFRLILKIVAHVMRRREVGSLLRVVNGRQVRLSSIRELTTYSVLAYLLIHVISNPR
eukprot:8331810-Pyramimonas_sp.AAC.1